MKILVAVDFSFASPGVLGFARAFALRCAAEVWLVHIAEPEPDFVGYGPGPRNVRNQVARKFHLAHRKLQEIAEDFRESGLAATALVIQGSTSAVIINESEKLGVDLILMGSHGHTALYRMLVGSVSAGVLKRSQRPVLVVPTLAPGSSPRRTRRSPKVTKLQKQNNKEEKA